MRDVDEGAEPWYFSGSAAATTRSCVWSLESGVGAKITRFRRLSGIVGDSNDMRTNVIQWKLQQLLIDDALKQFWCWVELWVEVLRGFWWMPSDWSTRRWVRTRGEQQKQRNAGFGGFWINFRSFDWQIGCVVWRFDTLVFVLNLCWRKQNKHDFDRRG